MTSLENRKLDRILFPGNPWQEGHAIPDFGWSGRLTPNGLYFDFNLMSEKYQNIDRNQRETDGDDDDLFEILQPDWESKTAWLSGGFCRLSSTLCGDASGIFVSDARRIALDCLEGTIFRIDPLPLGESPTPAFRAQILSAQDAVADHTIQFGTRIGPLAYSLVWNGRIKLDSSQDFEHTFQANVSSITLDRISVSDSLFGPESARVLARLIDEFDQFEYVEYEGRPADHSSKYGMPIEAIPPSCCFLRKAVT